ncbi:MAG: ABC transporter permease [Vampirovibrionales bacterium]|nr:ABC transporter permease [Vampirovibrionales bacterium]
MTRLLLQRLAGGAATLLLVACLTFGLLRAMPGGPFDREHRLPAAIQANMEARYHLNKPWPQQLGYYLAGLAHGDLGPSYQYATRRVNDILADAFPVSLLLGALALTLGVGLGGALGALAGWTQRRPLDATLCGIGALALSTPAFVFGGALALIFALWLKWLPAARLLSPTHGILPVLTLALGPFAFAFMLLRTSVRQTRALPFVTIKRSLGAPESRIALRHVLRNSLLPLLSIMGPLAAALVTGSFVVETLFAIPGMGKYFVTAVSNRDYPLVMGATLVYSALLIALNLVTDLLYGWLDPRLRDIGSAPSGGDART